jgi:NADH-quinone oxidoreductase subunit A
VAADRGVKHAPADKNKEKPLRILGLRFLTLSSFACYKHAFIHGQTSITMLNAYIPIFIFLLVAIGFALVTLMISQLLQSKKYNKVKLEPYECGIEPTTDARDRYSVRYYLVAMLFVIFDVETVFMFPWAVMVDELALFGLIEMIVFLAILGAGYVYAWKKGALEWA